MRRSHSRSPYRRTIIKDWFETHKEVYARFLLNPLRSLVNDLSHFMLTIDPYFDVAYTIPIRVPGCY